MCIDTVTWFCMDFSLHMDYNIVSFIPFSLYFHVGGIEIFISTVKGRLYWQKLMTRKVRKRTFGHVRPGTIQVIFRICAVRSASSFCTFCINKDSRPSSCRQQRLWVVCWFESLLGALVRFESSLGALVSFESSLGALVSLYCALLSDSSLRWALLSDSSLRWALLSDSSLRWALFSEDMFSYVVAQMFTILAFYEYWKFVNCFRADFGIYIF